MLSINKIKGRWFDISFLLPCILGALTIFIIYLVFNQTTLILKDRLRERLVAIAATAAIQFEGEDVNKIHTEKDLNINEVEEITTKMRSIRNENNNVRYVYILRPTAEINMTEFVLDADTIAPIDWDENGKIDEIEIPPVPGEEYDITDIPAVKSAFQVPTATEELYTDKWGTFLSGYAPIRNSKGESVAVLGIDVEVGDYFKVVQVTFIPFLLLSLLFLLILTIQTVSLTRIWRNRVELVKELDRQKDELLSIVSHQLAAPITSFNWYLELLLEEGTERKKEELKEFLTSMRSIAKDLTELVGMILDVSRFQLGKMKVERAEVDMDAFFKEILDVIQPKAKEKQQNFTIAVPQNLGKGSIDKRLSRMVVENLLTNAVKYTPEKGTVSFTVEKRNGVLFIEVKDTGVGIPKKDQAQIFGKLFRASNVHSINGNGFGLYIAKGAVESHGGHIRFESEENKGTTFFVELPV